MPISTLAKKWANLGALIRQSQDFPHNFKFVLEGNENGSCTPILSHRAFLEARLPTVSGDETFILPPWVQPKAFRLFYEVCQ